MASTPAEVPRADFVMLQCEKSVSIVLLSQSNVTAMQMEYSVAENDTERQRNFSMKFVLIALVLLIGLSVDLYLPSLTVIQQYFHLTYAQVQLTLGLYMVGFAVGQLFWGVLSDRHGRLRILMLALFLYFVVSIVCAASNSINTLILARFVQGIAGSCIPVSAYAITREIFEEKERTTMLAYLSMSISIVPVLAPILGGYLLIWFGWRSNFVLLSLFSLFMIILSMLILNRYVPKARKNEKNSVIKNYLLMFKHKEFVIYGVCLVASFSVLFAFIINAPYYLIHLIGIPERYFGYIMGANAIALFIGGAIVARISKYYSIQKIIFVGAVLMLLSAITMVMFSIFSAITLYNLMVPMVMVSFSAALIIPCAMSGALKPFTTQAGAASAVFGFSRYLIAAGAGGVVAYIDGESQLSLGIVMVLSALMILLLIRSYQKKVS